MTLPTQSKMNNIRFLLKRGRGWTNSLQPDTLILSPVQSGRRKFIRGGDANPGSRKKCWLALDYFFVSENLRKT
jgi:hypothetical protein